MKPTSRVGHPGRSGYTRAANPRLAQDLGHP